MNFIHSREHLSRGDVVVVDCSHQSNVLLTDDANFRGYKAGRGYEYHGGHFKQFPAEIVVPSTGYWNVTIDLGGGQANIKYSINVLKNK